MVNVRRLLLAAMLPLFLTGCPPDDEPEPGCEETGCPVGLLCTDGECRGCASDDECRAVDDDLVCRLQQCQPHVMSALAAAGEYDTFVEFAEQVGIYDRLAERADDFTLFVPDDDAFATLSGNCVAELQFEPAQLEAMLQMHIGLGVGYMTTDQLIVNAEANAEIPVETFDSIGVQVVDGQVEFGGLPVLGEAASNANGFAHRITGGVLFPAGAPAACVP